MYWTSIWWFCTMTWEVMNAIWWWACLLVEFGFSLCWSCIWVFFYIVNFCQLWLCEFFLCSFCFLIQNFVFCLSFELLNTTTMLYLLFSCLPCFTSQLSARIETSFVESHLVVQIWSFICYLEIVCLRLPDFSSYSLCCGSRFDETI